MNVGERIAGCLLGGAIGDAFGSAYEHVAEPDEDVYYPFGKPEPPKKKWQLTDDTQLTIATIEAIIERDGVEPEAIAHQMLQWYRAKRIVGIGSSSLKAMQELSQGGHYTQVGRRGEYSAGNGAAMRIAPLAFIASVDRDTVREVCRITHHSDEAYVGARCVIEAIRAASDGRWSGANTLIELLLPLLPDTRVRDRLRDVGRMNDLTAIAQLGNSGYVVDSVPLAIAAASQVRMIGMKAMYQSLIDIGGDTDTNCSIAGQVAGALLGKSALPKGHLSHLMDLTGSDTLQSTIDRFINWQSSQQQG